MFTGLVETLGTVMAVESKRSDGKRYHITTSDWHTSDLKLGDSIAVNGVCLTVEHLSSEGFWVFVSQETLDCTTLGSLACMSLVNLERSLTLAKPLGGHWVSGHVDGVGKVIERSSKDESVRLRMKVPSELAKYIAYKGSVCMDGVSLTVNEVEGVNFSIMVIPYTLQHTIIKNYDVDTEVNIEVDMMARYLDRLLSMMVIPQGIA